MISIKGGMIAISVNNILNITLYSGGRTALIGFNVETDLFLILLSNHQNSWYETVYKNDSVVITSLWRIPRDGKNTNSRLNELFHVFSKIGRAHV